MRRWIGGRAVTAARSTVAEAAGVERVVGSTVDEVEARGKHLMIRFSSGHVLHTHMRMHGAWHVYPAGERWRRPEWRARVVVECGSRVAVCFDAPVVELLERRAEPVHPPLAGLGPDVLSPDLDAGEVVRRARAGPPGSVVGEVLLDQRMVAGIGNIWRCESLFVAGLNPWTPLADLSDESLAGVVTAAAEMMRRSVAGAGHPPFRWVYRRVNQPCRRCGTGIESARMGSQVRTVYWCPVCQAPG